MSRSWISFEGEGSRGTFVGRGRDKLEEVLACIVVVCRQSVCNPTAPTAMGAGNQGLGTSVRERVFWRTSLLSVLEPLRPSPYIYDILFSV